jgi:Flp pilus assembly protein TadD
LTGLSYLGLKRYGEAIHTFKNLIKISNGHQHAIHGLIWAYCANGDLQEAGKLLDKLRHKARSEYVAATNLAVSAALMGDISSALSYLDKAYNDRDAMLITIKHSTHIPDALRNETGFQDLLNRIGFPDF